jgi:predicted pyridoxine 5'-phosphate oxidase superfamily flavin-nucleotide-binding protein
MDYVEQQRLKLYGRAKIFEETAESQALIDKFRTEEKDAWPERAVVIHIEAFDWNCPQHITPRFTLEELDALNKETIG